MTHRVDLTGRQRPWPADLLALWRECLAEAVDDGRYWSSPPYRGVPELRQVLADQLGVPADRLTITTGVRAAARAAIGAARTVWVEAPTFAGVPQCLRRQGIAVRHEPWSTLLVRGYGAADALWLTSPARNPDGASLDAGQRQRLRDLAGAGTRIVLNDSYRWTGDRPAPRIPGAVVVGTFAKLLGMGARLGYLVSAEEPGPLERGMCPPTGWQLAWWRFLVRGGLTAVRAAIGAPRQRVSTLLAEYLTARGLAGADFAGESCLLPLAPGAAEDGWVARAASLGLIVAPGRAFLARRPSIRVALTSVGPDEVPAILDRLDRLRQEQPTSRPGVSSRCAS
jgi:DNA-binding transcriptional MocR family regulator